MKIKELADRERQNVADVFDNYEMSIEAKSREIVKNTWKKVVKKNLLEMIDSIEIK